MKLIKFLILPFLSVLVFAQTATDKKLITAGNYYKNKEYSQVIETLKNESPSDYRVLFFNIASKYELQDTTTNVDEIYENCDYITVHVPALDSTKGMIGKDALSLMKEGVIVLNFARDVLVDSEAMVDALVAGKVKH